MLAGPGFPFDEDWHRGLAARSYDRSFYAQGMARQLTFGTLVALNFVIAAVLVKATPSWDVPHHFH